MGVVTTNFASLHVTSLDGLPLPSADLKSPFVFTRAKNAHFSTYMCPISYVSPLQPVYIEFGVQN
jgi:hypothetical protein